MYCTTLATISAPIWWQAEMTGPAARRSAMEIAAELRAVSARPGPSLCCGFHQGTSETLRWLCLGGYGPLTGEPSARPVTTRAIEAEDSVAGMLFTGPPSRHRDFARGVEQALLWAQGATVTHPDGCPCTTARTVATRTRATAPRSAPVEPSTTDNGPGPARW